MMPAAGLCHRTHQELATQPIEVYRGPSATVRAPRAAPQKMAPPPNMMSQVMAKPSLMYMSGVIGWK